MRPAQTISGSGFFLGALVGGSIGSIYGADPAFVGGVVGGAVGLLLIPPFEPP